MPPPAHAPQPEVRAKPRNALGGDTVPHSGLCGSSSIRKSTGRLSDEEAREEEERSKAKGNGGSVKDRRKMFEQKRDGREGELTRTGSFILVLAVRGKNQGK